MWTSTTYPIRWSGSPDIENVTIDYSLDGGVTWSSAIYPKPYTPNDGYCGWAVPASGLSFDGIQWFAPTANRCVTECFSPTTHA